MKRLIYIIVLVLSAPLYCYSQMVTYSTPVREDSRDINFEVIGKMKGDFLIFKNLKNNYEVSIYDSDMQLVNTMKLDFLPEKTFNVNFVAYPDFFYLIYQYQRKGIVHCMAARLNAESKLVADPIELDTTKLDWFDDSKIYTTINSDDKQKIMVFKIQRKNDELNFGTLLLDNQLKLLKASRTSLKYDDNRNTLSDFFVDNDGNFVFTRSYRQGKDNISSLDLVVKSSMADTFAIHNINLFKHYTDETKLKIDNINKHYIINSFYYDGRRGDIEGLFSNIWSSQTDSSLTTNFAKFSDELRASAQTEGSTKEVFNSFFIRNVIVKKDGGFILTAEDYSTRSNNINNPWNRWDYLYGTPYTLTPYGYYNYNPSAYWMYRPYSDLYNNQSTRFYYDNILLVSIASDGTADWSNVLNKQQYGTDDDNYLSYITFNTGAGIHFLFNEMERRDMTIADNLLSPQGIVSKQLPLKGVDDDYQFMPKFGRQVSARQLIIPCTYRNSISFARIDY